MFKTKINKTLGEPCETIASLAVKTSPQLTSSCLEY
ncbi:hypothetical protein ACSSV5_000085 [Psychroflexus sp. MBR-150]